MPTSDSIGGTPPLAFATCLKANSRFTDVAMNHSSRATGPARYFVTYRPSNPERVADMLHRQQDARQERAESERFEFLADKDGGRPFHWCVNPATGGVYQTTPRQLHLPRQAVSRRAGRLQAPAGAAERAAMTDPTLDALRAVPPKSLLTHRAGVSVASGLVWMQGGRRVAGEGIAACAGSGLLVSVRLFKARASSVVWLYHYALFREDPPHRMQEGTCLTEKWLLKRDQ